MGKIFGLEFEKMVEKQLDESKDDGFVEAEVTWENYQGESTDMHSPEVVAYAEPWMEMYNKGNHLDSNWLTIPKGKEGGPLAPERTVFAASPVTAGDNRNSKVTVKWTVWEDSRKLKKTEVELYAVMRAEYYFIEKKGYKKLNSDYFVPERYRRARKKGKWGWYKTGYSYGIDSFFVKGPNTAKDEVKYIICESKFTCNEAEFEKLKRPTCVGTRYDKLNRNYPPVQMSWDWILGAARRATYWPSQQWPASSIDFMKTRKESKINYIDLEVIREDLKESMVEMANLRKTIRRREYNNIKRYLNIFGAARVPVYPGIYLLASLRKKTTNSLLHLKWDKLKKEIDFESEFYPLDDDFDDWCAIRLKNMKTKRRKGSYKKI